MQKDNHNLLKMDKDSSNLIRYIQGKLNDAERKAFEKQLENTPELQEEVSFLKDLTEVSQFKGLMEEAHEELEVEEEQFTASPATPKEAKVRAIFPLRRVLAYAAAIAILVVAAGFWYANQNYSDLGLASAQMERLGLQGQGLENYRSDTEIQDAFQKGLTALDTENYSGAIDFFNAISPAEDNYLPARLFLALAQFEEKQYVETIANTKIVAEQSQNAVTRQRAEWLQLKALLVNGYQTAFAVLAKAISTDESHMFKNDAEALLQKTNSFWRRLAR